MKNWGSPLNNWWRTMEEQMKKWYRVDQELMKKLWISFVNEKELMKNCWRAAEDLMNNWWSTDEESTNNLRVLQQLATCVPTPWQNWTGQNNSFKSDFQWFIPSLSKLNLKIWLTAIQRNNCFCRNRKIHSKNSFWYRTIDISNKSIGVDGRGLGW